MQSSHSAAVQKFANKKLLDIETLDREWTYLDQAIEIIFDKQILEPEQYIKLDRIVRFICKSNYTDWLYDKLTGKLDGYIDNIVYTLSIYETSLDDSVYKYILTINNLYSQFTKVRSIFLYLERDFLIFRKDYMTIQEIAVSKLKYYFTRYTKLKDKIIRCCIELIQEQRQKRNRNDEFVKELIKIVEKVEIYSEFEREYLESLERFYQGQAEERRKWYHIGEYLEYAEDIIRKEQQIWDQYLDKKTVKKVGNLMIEILVRRNVKYLMSRVEEIMDCRGYKELASMYNLIQKASQTHELKASLESYIISKINYLLSLSLNSLIQNLISLYLQTSQTFSKSLPNSSPFAEIPHQCFKSSLFPHSNLLSYLLCRYLDSLLRPSNQPSDSTILSSLSNSMFLFDILTDKDLFSEYYTKFLCSRLLFNSYISLDLEQTALNKLRLSSYANYTERMSSMIGDIQISSLYMEQFYGTEYYNKVCKKSNIQYEVKVLNAAKWPKYESCNIALPSELKAIQDEFVKYYGVIQKSKVLIWKHNLSYCIVTYRGNNIKELRCSFYQSLILILFNKYREITVDLIENVTGILTGDVKEHILPMLKGECGLLLKTGSGDSIGNSDAFRVNEEFKSNRKVDYCSGLLETSKDIRKKKHRKALENVAERRKEAIEACIVRIMKNRKVMRFNEILSEVMSELQLPLNHADIKHRLESLVAREYLSQSNECVQEYTYIP